MRLVDHGSIEGRLEASHMISENLQAEVDLMRQVQQRQVPPPEVEAAEASATEAGASSSSSMDAIPPHVLVLCAGGLPEKAVRLISSFLGCRCPVCDAGMPFLVRFDDGRYEFMCLTCAKVVRESIEDH